MKRFLVTSSLIVAALTSSAGQAQGPTMEKGNIEELRGATSVYVGARPGETWIRRKVIDTLRKEIPQLDVVILPEDADVWFLISDERDVQSEIAVRGVPRDDVDRRTGADVGRSKVVYKLKGQIILAGIPTRHRLVRKVSASGSDIKDVAGKLALEFIASYTKANRGQPSASTVHQPATSARPTLHLKKSPVNAKPGNSSIPAKADAEALGEDDVVRVDTSLVTIHADVVSRDGKPATSLQSDAFSVYEDDVKQDLAFVEPVERPFTVVLLIDSSGSVRPRLKAIADATKILIDNLRPDDQIVGVSFDYETREVMKLTRVRDLRDKGMNLTSGGGTRLYDAVEFVIGRYLRRLPGRKAVVMLTDGIDGTMTDGPDGGSFVATADSNVRDAEELDALFYAVQYNTWVEPIDRPRSGMTDTELRKFWEERSTAYLQSLTQKTAGRMYRADNLGDLAPAFASIVAELSRQYSLGYYPKRSPQEGERRRIKVRVTSPDLVVRARDSYVSKSPSAKPAGPR